MQNKFHSMNPSSHLPYKGTSAGAWTDKHYDLLAKMELALAAMQSSVIEDDLPPRILYPHSEHYLGNLRRLRISKEPAPGFYDINLIDGLVKFSTAMLDAIGLLNSEDELTRFTQEFFLHEILHVDQGLYSSNWYGVEYASVVLEQMDYYADAFATATLITWQSRIHPEVSLQEIVKNCGYVAIRGLEIFDQMDYPDGMTQISDARLRRYLIWYTQYERLLAARTLDQVLKTLYPLVAVELATLYGTIDEYGQKIITECPESAQYFLAMDGMLVRQANMPGFDVTVLFNAILAYDSETALDQIRYVVMEYRKLLLPEL